jgi:hypothetical protein
MPKYYARHGLHLRACHGQERVYLEGEPWPSMAQAVGVLGGIYCSPYPAFILIKYLQNKIFIRIFAYAILHDNPQIPFTNDKIAPCLYYHPTIINQVAIPGHPKLP